MILNIKPAVKTQADEIEAVAADCLSGDERLSDYSADNVLSLMRSSLLTSVVVCDKVVRGFCVCERSPIPDGCEITGIYVADGFRSIGLGRKLLSYALREARGKRYKTAFLWVRDGNERAERFFRRIGFEPDGKRRLIDPAADCYELRYRIDI